MMIWKESTTKWFQIQNGGHKPSCLYKKILAGNLYCSPSPPHFVAEIWRWMDYQQYSIMIHNAYVPDIDLHKPWFGTWLFIYGGRQRMKKHFPGFPKPPAIGQGVEVDDLRKELKINAELQKCLWKTGPELGRTFGAGWTWIDLNSRGLQPRRE